MTSMLYRTLIMLLDALAVPLSLPARIAARLRTARTRKERVTLQAAGWFAVAVALGVMAGMIVWELKGAMK